MPRYSVDVIEQVRFLRSQGSTYSEIKNILEREIPKSTLYEWCKNVTLPASYRAKIIALNSINIKKAQIVAHKVNKAKREEYLQYINSINNQIAPLVSSMDTAKIALAMLCLGEASKYKSSSSFSLGNSDPRIITLFIELLKLCFDFDKEKIRCTVQCRADQNIDELEFYWRNVTGVPKRLFYKAQVDPRTIGKPTKKVDYKGVLRVDYLDTKVQLELESLADLLYSYLSKQRARSLTG